MESIKRKIGAITGVCVETICLSETFEQAAARFAHLPGTVVLLSGTDLDCARYHILGALPWLEMTARGTRLTIRVDAAEHRIRMQPFDALQTLMAHCRLPADRQWPAPIAAGLLGYFAYDLKDHLEKLPRTTVDDLGLPHLCLYAPSALMVQDRQEGTTRLCIPLRDNVDAPAVRRRFLDLLEHPPRSGNPQNRAPGNYRANFTRERYMETVASIRDYIRRGDVYQVNLSQRFQFPYDAPPYDLFQALFDRNPAPFFAFIQAGDHQVVSTSPERFIRRQGRRVETRPIKGTLPRGETPQQDAENRRLLLTSIKDDAELSMIVDLLRNDIGKVCESGSVRVAAHKRVEAYQNVYHLVSDVEGKLAIGQDTVDLIRAVFPGGSITGCPKIRAMELIDLLEPHRRHVYTGAIGYLSFHETLDLSIAIRTATITDGRLVFSVGGGIVIDSDPSAEYEETLHKGRTLLELCHGGGKTEKTPMAWHNGNLRPSSEVTLPFSDAGALYGFGLFETIRVDGGRISLLASHLRRFSTSWRRLFETPVPDITWADVIDQVVQANGLSDRTAAVKLFASAGSRNALAVDQQLVVTATPYTPRPACAHGTGLRLATYPEPRQSPLAAHKTANYLFYLLAGKWARKAGADEALVLNPDGSISETNTANLIVVSGRQALLPTSPHVLPGVMQKRAAAILAGMGFTVSWERLAPAAIIKADHVLLTNALMGAAPAVSLDGIPLAHDGKLAAGINARVWPPGNEAAPGGQEPVSPSQR